MYLSSISPKGTIQLRQESVLMKIEVTYIYNAYAGTPTSHGMLWSSLGNAMTAYLMQYFCTKDRLGSKKAQDRTITAICKFLRSI
jgi:hypothetical protein